MTDLSKRLEESRAAVADLILAADRSASVWSRPRAPGKWSPSQIVEHVARTLEESANLFAGKPAKFPNFPAPLRPVIRGVLFNRVVRSGRFPNARTNKPMNPLSGPATVEEGRVRLQQAQEMFERECLACAANGDRTTSATFGQISTADYVRFIELHTRHHRMQMPDA